MAVLSKFHGFFLLTFLFSLLGSFTLCTATETDIACLKSIKDSLEDPHNQFKSSWNFNNDTEGFICSFIGIGCWHNDENRVLQIQLSGMGLKGQFPLVLQNCTNLSDLDLSSNDLSGPIPSNISKIIPYITSLDLSSNKFSGEIPANIANCSYLNVLKLDDNQLTGSIPAEIGLCGRIKDFSVANNLLTGPVPSFVSANITYKSYANNRALCGGPLEPCEENRKKNSFRDGFMIGYVVFLVSVAVVFMPYWPPCVHDRNMNKMVTLATIVMLMMRKMKTKKKNEEEEEEGEEVKADKVQDLSTLALIQHSSREITVLEKKVTRISYADLSNLTDNFNESEVIGLGKMGTMYKATLPDGSLLAVKKFHDSQILEEQFTLEMKTLGTLKHVNLLPLLGFCITSEQRFLVYKYMPNGNLFDWLHCSEVKAKILEWPVRAKIATGLARGLSWLHHECSKRVIHLDISSKCILLDHNFEPKLSNFGEAMLIIRNVTSSFCVNDGFWEMAFLKEDVFSFGVVLLELISGQDPSKMPCYEVFPHEWISYLLSSHSSFYDMIDKSLVGQGFDAEIFQYLQVAFNCVHFDPDRRPTMFEVYGHIKNVLGERYFIIDDSKKCK